MKAILHIGTEKTGTTSIQSFLAMNRPLLRKAGFLVPASLGPTNHRILPALVTSDDYFDEFFRRQRLFDLASRRDAKLRWREAFRRQLDRARPHTVLISSEHLQSRLRSDAEVAALRDYLSTLFDDIRILIYLRDPAETAASSHSTAIKNGKTRLDLPPPGDAYVRLIADHQATLTRWAACFGLQSLTVRLFDPAAFHNGTLLDDYIQAGALPDLAYSLPPRRNESLSAYGLDVLRRLNHLLPVLLPDGSFNTRRRGLAAFFETHFGQGPRMTPDAAWREDYAQAFAASNEWVRQNFFPERSHLFPPAPPSQAARPVIDPDFAEATARAIADLWQHRTAQGQNAGDDD